MSCPHHNQYPSSRRTINGSERVVFQCMDCGAELIYEEPVGHNGNDISITSVPTYAATIYVGLLNRDTGEIINRKRAVDLVQRYCDEIGLCVTITDTQYVYTEGGEPGLIVGLINYPRFPSTTEQIDSRALRLAESLLIECEQYKVSVVFPDRTVMLSREQESAS